VHPLPDSISDQEGALLEPLAVAVHAVRRSGMAAGDGVAIVGAGPIGLVTLAAARAAGAGELLVVERAAARKEKALEIGAHHVIDPGDGEPVAQIRALTPGGLGVDVAFECVGHQVTLNVALNALRKGGTAAIVGVFEEPSSVHFNDLVLSERSLVGCLAYVDDFPRAIALLADGRIDAAPLITSRVTLQEAIAGGFQELVRNRDGHVKILVDPSASQAPVPRARPRLR
jgi:(R,R)-butanediol dehydrogenase/meso-butanediol dehydrogenase/diacetyl reductase